MLTVKMKACQTEGSADARYPPDPNLLPRGESELRRSRDPWVITGAVDLFWRMVYN